MTAHHWTTSRSLVRRLAAIVGLSVALTGVGVVAPAFAVEGPLTVVSLTFDDANADQLAAVDILNAAGLKGTFFVPSGYVDAAGYLTRAQVLGIAADGHEIGGHTVTHADLTTISAAAAKLQVCEDRATLTGWGLNIRSFAYPFAAVDAQAMTAASECNYNSARGLGDIESRFGCTGCYNAEALPPLVPFYTMALDQQDVNWTLDDLTSAVERAETAGGGWLQYTFHHVCNGCDSLSITPALLQQFVDWLVARGVTNNTVVRTVGDAVGGATKPLVESELPPAPGPGVNGIVNPSLETAGTGGVPQCWQLGGYGTNTPVFSQVTPGRTGSVAEQLIMSGYVDGDAKLLPTLDLGECAPTVTPGRTYSLRAWYTSTATTQFEVYLRSNVGTWVYWTSSPWFAASAEYSHAYWTTGAIPAGYNGISFGLNLFSNGTLTTDDYALYDTVGAPGELGDLVAVTPTITGTAKVGEQLTAEPGAWTPEGVVLGFQWLRGDAAIDGATSNHYTAVAADVGSTLSVKVSGALSGYTPATGTSLPTATVLPGELVPGTPEVTGTAEVGREVTAVPGTWLPAGVTFSYQWMRAGNPISGAESVSYTIAPADLGSVLSVQITGSASGYVSETLSATMSASVTPGSLTGSTPSITGAPVVGGELTATPGAWAPDPVTLSFAWLQNGVEIPGANAASYTLTAADFAKQLSVRVTGTKEGYVTLARTSDSVTVTKSDFAVSRLAGADRYATSVRVSQEYAPGVARAYVASGQNYPDGLSAGAAAAHFDGPLLLTKSGSLPEVVRAELVRLAPVQIVVAGGTGTVSNAVVQQLEAIAPVLRVAGPDRYATSRALALDAFTSATTAYIATGTSFADGLSASPAAAHLDGPVILVRGTSSSLDAATMETLTALGVTTVKIAGGTGVVSAGIEAQLVTIFGADNVTRLGGANRYATAIAINADAFDSSRTVFLASGSQFPDALSGAALSGLRDAPLFLSTRDCVPQQVLDAINALGADTVVLIGGTGVLTDRVFALSPCA